VSYHAMASSTASPGSYPNGTTEWPTPQWLVDQLAEEFASGGFNLDPAATRATRRHRGSSPPTTVWPSPGTLGRSG
jgi:hypothetical protein